MLGTDLCKAFSSTDLIALDREDLDVTDNNEVLEKINSVKPELIINATGYTNVDGAETDKAAAFLLNGEAVKNLVEAAQSIGAKIIHFSTEYVFDGANQVGYSEEAQINPINIYGESKAVGEKYVLEYVRGFLIRTSWLYGRSPQRGKPRGINFVDTMIKLAQEKSELKVVSDQFGKPTFTVDLARAVFNLIDEDYKPGIYHLVNEGVCSWFDFAKKILEIKKSSTPIHPISSAEYATSANRPKYSVLINTKYPLLRPWSEALQEYLS